MRQLKSGSGWRLGWNSETEFWGLIGTDDWAIELTQAEFEDFCRLALQLANTMTQMNHELMQEERISCELESDLMWLEVDGYPEDYQLRFILLTGRGVEGTLASKAVSALLEAFPSKLITN
jgi:hypothetical protein